MAQLTPYLILFVQLLAAAALIVAGTIKLAEPAAIRQTITQLGLPSVSALARLLGLCELGTGLALVMLPSNLITAGLVLGLALAFAGAGFRAAGGGLQIECACFGSSFSTHLGWRQIVLAPAWIGVAASVVLEPVAMRAQRPLVAFLLTSIIALGALWKLLPLLAEHSVQRRAVDGA